MTWIEIAAIAIALILQTTALLALRQMRDRQATLDTAVDEAEARALELVRRLKAFDELGEDREFAAQMIDGGSSLAKNLHRGIWDLPTPILSDLPGASRVARETSENISRDISRMVDALNKRKSSRRKNENGDDSDRNPR